MKPKQIGPAVEDELKSVRFIDVHTHLFKPSLDRLGLWGIDDLLTYHYLEAELFRSSSMTPDEYWLLSKEKKADTIWQALFVQNPPVSEATRGVVAVLDALGLPKATRDLKEARDFFAAQNLEQHIDRVFELAGISEAVMTNDPLDPVESALWLKHPEEDPRFHAALRIDRIVAEWPARWNNSISELRRFLRDWCDRMKPVYLAVSLTDSFTYPGEDSSHSTALKDAILPACREFDIPLSLMIGVRRQVNPAIRLAGDAVGKADLRSLEYLCREFPHNRFLVSVLSRENQHELCVYARKFSNLMPFGCWWFLNNPSIVEEITRERIEMLGWSFIPQHSDARILEQVIYKWRNTRRTLTPILANTYRLLVEDG
ncbi:MAG: hypothetical protein JO210_18680, partial [Acidobacteriaceae bacterium]|nr:hypothetical protein [Acidobacteriaceae bacterium]